MEGSESTLSGLPEEPRARPWLSLSVLLFLTSLAGVIHFLSLERRTFWLDESCSYLLARDGLSGLPKRLPNEGIPPLYPAILSLTIDRFGIDPVPLRFPSAIFATLLVPLVFWASRSAVGDGRALLASALAAISPIVHFHGTEARSYALLILLSAATMGAARWVCVSPAGWRSWLALAAAMIGACWTHHLGLFLVPAVITTTLLWPRFSWARLAGTLGLGVVAVLLNLPWVQQGLRLTLAEPWLERNWNALPPALALARSLEVLGFGGEYPGYLGPLEGTGLSRWLALPFNSLAVLLGLWFVTRDAKEGTFGWLASFLFVPLVLLWLQSLLRKPLYLPGRYDVLVLPAIFVALSATLGGLLARPPTRGLGILVALLLVGLAARSLHGWFTQQKDDPFSVECAEVAHWIHQNGGPSEPILCLGMTRAVIEYELKRAGDERPILVFPREIELHPGWYDESAMSRDSSQLKREAEKLADEIASSVGDGGKLWVVVSIFERVDQVILEALRQRFHLAEDPLPDHLPILLFRVKGSAGPQPAGG